MPFSTREIGELCQREKCRIHTVPRHRFEAARELGSAFHPRTELYRCAVAFGQTEVADQSRIVDGNDEPDLLSDVFVGVLCAVLDDQREILQREEVSTLPRTILVGIEPQLWSRPCRWNHQKNAHQQHKQATTPAHEVYSAQKRH